MTKIFLLIVICVALSGCASVENQPKMSSHGWSWKTFSHSEHQGFYVDGPIRWYQYYEHNNWYMTGGKPYGFLGAIYTVFHPEWWFWYGDVNSKSHLYQCKFKPGCAKCEEEKIREKKWIDDRFTDEKERIEYSVKHYGTPDVMIAPKDGE